MLERCARVSDLKMGRLETLAKLVDSCKSLDGDFVEVGVYRGGSARLICELVPEKTVHLFDTFTGLPQPTHEGDKHRKHDWNDTGVDVVKDTLAGLENYRLYEGEFPHTLPADFAQSLAFVHMDTDLHAPTAAAIELLWPRIVPGGVMLFDDYGGQLCKGVMVAVNDWINGSGYRLEHHGISVSVRKT